MELKPFIRNVEGSRVYYDVLSSKKTFYYTVEMLGLTAISCDCRAGQFNKCKKHRETAEKAEREFQQENSAKIPSSSTHDEQRRREIAPLNGDRSFSILR